MHMISRLFRRSDGEPEPLDVRALLDMCQKDQRHASAALRQLEAERRRLLRQRKNLQKRASRFSAARVRDIARTGPQFGPMQLQTEMRIRDEAGRSTNLSLQESDLEERLRDVEQAKVSIRRLTTTGNIA